MAMQESGEMYLETILILSERKASVRAIDVVEYMNFSKPSVSRAVNGLRDDGYIDIDDGHLITLTEKGYNLASRIYERHRVLTEYLELLGVSSDNASDDACKIEHDISDESFEAVKKHLKVLKAQDSGQ